MRKLVRWVGIVFGSVLLLIVVLASAAFLTTRSKLGRTVQLDVEAPVVQATQESIERGRHIAESISSCAVCHAGDFGGQMVIDEPVFARISAPNLTTGQGGLQNYTDADWDRAIRHGIGGDGRRLIIMPSLHFQRMSDTDLGAMIAFLRTVAPVDREMQRPRPGPIGTVLLALGQLPFFADEIDHANAGKHVVTPAASAEYGEYLADIAGCEGCHGDSFVGRPAAPNGPPGGPNLTPSGNPGRWSAEQFRSVLRTGQTPEGRSLQVQHMPWPQYARMTDMEIDALWLHIKSLPPSTSSE
jgi:cytochrome c553